MKKRLTLIFVCLGVFLALLATYILVVLPLADNSSEAEETTAEPLVPGEVIGANGRVQMFDYVSSADVSSIYVHNSYGGYSIVSSDGSLVIEGYETRLLDREKLTQMIINAGYTLSTYNSAVKEEDFVKYGLSDSENYFVLKTTAGKRYTVYIGDKTLAGDGYYARYEGRDAVYVLDGSIENDLLAPVSNLVRPLLAYPSSMNSYYLMQTFTLARGENILLSAQYLDPDKRSDLAAMSVHQLTFPASYPASTNYDNVLTLFCDFSGTKTLAIDMTNETLAKYGLDKPAYTLYAVNTSVDDDGNPKSLVENYITFSEKQQDDDGSYYYYAASYTFGVVVRVEQITLDFLEWNLEKWVSPNIFQINIANVSSLKFDCADIAETFLLTGNDNDSLKVAKKSDGTFLDMKNFRQMWKVLLTVTQDGSVEFTDAEREALTGDNSNLLLTMTVTTRAGVERTYRFYPYTDRRVFYTIDGEGEFFVNRTMVNKIIADAQRVSNGETVDSEAKY